MHDSIMAIIAIINFIADVGGLWATIVVAGLYLGFWNFDNLNRELVRRG